MCDYCKHRNIEEMKCGDKFLLRWTYSVFGDGWEDNGGKFNYCPNCGDKLTRKVM